MTEQEARQKWCPMVRPSGVSMKEIRSAHEMRCIASECMAWRWGSAVEVDDKPTLEAHGYCGLAGKP